MTGYLLFPDFDPILIQIGPIAIRWYSLAYITGFILGWRLILLLVRHRCSDRLTPQHIDDFLIWCVIATVLGGRLGYVLFYFPDRFFADPIQIVQIWRGGMSFHGGLGGVALAICLFARLRGVSILSLADLVATVAPIGLLFGRLANFVNGELWGRVTDMPWGMVFPGAGALPRHPSQLYEAVLEGLILLILLQIWAWRGQLLARPGLAAGMFLILYSVMRFTVEFFREPDSGLGFMAGDWVTMGQILCVPMLLSGLGLVVWPNRHAK